MILHELTGYYQLVFLMFSMIVCEIKPWSYYWALCASIKLVGSPGQFRILDFRFRIELVRETIRNPQSEIRNKSYAAKHG